MNKLGLLPILTPGKGRYTAGHPFSESISYMKRPKFINLQARSVNSREGGQLTPLNETSTSGDSFRGYA